MTEALVAPGAFTITWKVDPDNAKVGLENSGVVIVTVDGAYECIRIILSIGLSELLVLEKSDVAHEHDTIEKTNAIHINVLAIIFMRSLLFYLI